MPEDGLSIRDGRQHDAAAGPVVIEDDDDDDDDEDGGTSGSVPAKRKRVPTVEKWANLTSRHYWIKRSPEARAMYLTSGHIYCSICSDCISVNTSGTPAKRHEEKKHLPTTPLMQQHIALCARLGIPETSNNIAIDAARSRTTAGGVSTTDVRFMFAEASAKVTQSQKAQVRAALTLHLGRYMPISNVRYVFTEEVLRCMLLLGPTTSVGKGGTVQRDVADGLQAMQAAIKLQAKGKYVTVILDAASTGLLHGSKPFAFLLYWAGLEKPLLADVLFAPVEAEVVSHRVVAEMIKTALKNLGIDPTTHLVGLAGDNASINPATAAALGVPHLKCIAHALHLVYQELIAPFRRFMAVTLGLSTLISAGGSEKRKQAFEGAKLSSSSLHCIFTRWASLHTMGVYVRENYQKISQVLMEHRAFDGDAIVEEEDRVGFRWDIPAAPATNPRAGGAAAIGKRSHDGEPIHPPRDSRRFKQSEIKAFFADPRTYLELLLLEDLGNKIQHLIRLSQMDSSLDFPSFIVELTKLRATLSACTFGAQGMVESAAGRATAAGVPVDDPAIIAEYAKTLDTACADAAIKFDAHVQVAIDRLGFRSLYDPSVKPTARSYSTGPLAAAAMGFIPDDPDWLTLLVEYNTYVNLYDSPSQVLPVKLPMGEFWAHPDVVKTLPKIALLGQWYGSYVTSSVAAERAFGVMRAIDVPNRRKMSLALLKHQMLSRYDKAGVDNHLLTTLAACTPPALSSLVAPLKGVTDVSAVDPLLVGEQPGGPASDASAGGGAGGSMSDIPDVV
jgi:hypothetical protein